MPHLALNVAAFPVGNLSRHVPDSLQRIAVGTSDALRRLAPLIAIHPQASVVLRQVHMLEKSGCAGGGCSKASLSPVELGWELFSWLPGAHGDAWTVILLVNEASHPPVRFKGSTAGAAPSVALSGRVLLIGFDGAGPDEVGHAAVVAEVASWLWKGIAADEGDGLPQLAEKLQRACLDDAAVAVKRFLALVDQFPEVRISPAAASLAEEVAASFTAAAAEVRNGADWESGLQRSRVAWSKAQALVAHPDVGAKPQLPTEHILALLLPIGLPISLAIVQAVGREVVLWRKRGKVE